MTLTVSHLLESWLKYAHTIGRKESAPPEPNHSNGGRFLHLRPMLDANIIASRAPARLTSSICTPDARLYQGYGTLYAWTYAHVLDVGYI